MEAGSISSPGRPLKPTGAGRRRKDKAARSILWLATIVAILPLVLVIFYTLRKGIGAFSTEFFTTDPTGDFLGAQGGVKSAILGTIEIVGFATLVAVPLGIGVALYLTEFGGDGKLAQVVRFFIDVMTGVPSIVVRPLHLHNARPRRHRRLELRRLEGVRRARPADAADRDPLG